MEMIKKEWAKDVQAIKTKSEEGQILDKTGEVTFVHR